MSVTFDPERNEIDALLEFVGDLAGKRVLEIGAGYGRLTWRYASKAGEVVAIDPNPERIARAQNDIPKELRGRISLLETTLEEYQRDVQAPLFDVALMSWAL
ncbi:MAG: class I SAM-dependent methyltransferase [Anaerolineales bacterium]|nr:class I SAM-dependent methyltransferase [Anaerolineales bacterium]